MNIIFVGEKRLFYVLTLGNTNVHYICHVTERHKKHIVEGGNNILFSILKVFRYTSVKLEESKQIDRYESKNRNQAIEPRNLNNMGKQFVCHYVS